MELKELIHLYYNILYKFNNYYIKYYDNNSDIYKVGISTITHIFKLSLIQKKNIVEYCENSIYYFFEFITQVKNNSDQYLHLQSKDATIFILKKFFSENLYDHCKENKLKANLYIFEYIESITTIFMDIVFFYTYSENNIENYYKKFIFYLINLDLDQLKLYHYYLPYILKNIPLKQLNKYNISLVNTIKPLTKTQIMHLKNNIFKFDTIMKPTIAIKQLL